MILLLIAMQAAPVPTPPDLQIKGSVTAKSVVIESAGRVEASVRAEPDGGSGVDIEKSRAADRAKRLSNVGIDFDIHANLADPATQTQTQIQTPATSDAIAETDAPRSDPN